MNKLMWKLWYKFQYFWNWGMGAPTPTLPPELPDDIGIGEEIYEELLDPEEYAKFKENN